MYKEIWLLLVGGILTPEPPMRDLLSVSRMVLSSGMSHENFLWVFWHFLRHGWTVTHEVQQLLPFSFYLTQISPI